ncbi:hypothetical protein CDL12_10166 [Handroanthus impetiginosus]|uniref:Uncharacterized protein n=1 Tax=Handroanthus impetiginosus TaxID=429701 RepID=A0A2G9HI58_9LAMI|nr:hypothetical protein CDL12_10166 [Handroanthus impetiginosus]
MGVQTIMKASRPSAPVVSKSSSRSSTPTRKPATPSTTWKGAPSRGTSPSVRSRQSKPSQILSSSHDATQNPRISMPKRAASASRTRSSSHTEKPRQKSCSPTKVRAPISTGNKPGSKILTKSRGSGNDGDDVNPVIMGTKMVDRVVNMRKLAPPKRDECVSHDNHRKSSQENSGFGRSLSKKSLDMALRHMDIRLSIPDKVRPIAKGVSSFAKINTNGV